MPYVLISGETGGETVTVRLPYAALNELAALWEMTKPPALRPMSEAKDEGPLLAWHKVGFWIVVEWVDTPASPGYPWETVEDCGYSEEALAGWIPLPPNPEVTP